MRSVSAYSSTVNSARASYLRRESSSGANTRVLRRHGNVLIVTCLCRFVCQTGFSYVAKRSFLHRGRASSAPVASRRHTRPTAEEAFLSCGKASSAHQEAHSDVTACAKRAFHRGRTASGEAVSRFLIVKIFYCRKAINIHPYIHG